MKALISVYDKTDVAAFAAELRKMGWEIISTGGTYDILRKNGLEPVNISDYTLSPEVLEGRVKTLHPKIYMGLLARADQQAELDAHDTPRIDLVCCNLYPFEDTLKKTGDEARILENIDIGGVCLLRAAAKNYERVLVVSDPGDYREAAHRLGSGTADRDYRKKLAAKAFGVTMKYDTAISGYFGGQAGGERLNLSLAKTMDLRYGENSHQKAALYGPIPFEKIRGEKELSFNNIQDTNAAVNIVREFSGPAAVIIKHIVPCGAALSGDIGGAYSKALQSDPMSAFGGIVGLNREVDAQLAGEIVKNFYEVVAAPGYSEEALAVFGGKPNLRIIRYGQERASLDMRYVSGAMLVQDADSFEGEKWEVVTAAKPAKEQEEDLLFAWKIVRFLKSNAIAVAKGRQTYGLGSGETARVGAVEVALSKMKQFFGVQEAVVMASDAFFPFPDAVEKAAQANVKAIIQPGGSRNDKAVIEAADRLGISMIFSGRRHFLH
ncbi:MAG: bifunctional phosphoribosylaminoimidazolecarboxamide formyltransferase/IMP cyclohydrolase [Elusimicrobia bacterium]|nr:bifunctional phosphoribosylaminoimidazolecarboxamide formyltransferase/IMP cyclohydrolase [Elusimicrobiota bacterium]